MKTPLARLAIFASGFGSNLQVIMDHCRQGLIPAKVVLVLSDKKNACALTKAQQENIETLCVPPKDHGSREAYDQVLEKLCRERNIDWIVLAGFMRVLGPTFVRAFSGRVVNIHPALLPQYRGLHAIERAYQNKEERIGVTVHLVDEGVDTGPIVLQEAIEVRKEQSLTELIERVHELEHRLFPLALHQLLEK